MDDLSGQVIKSYELVERIGIGSFGMVYRAHQRQVKREVAIKIISPRFANHPDFIRAFEAEAQLIARLEHLHIVPLYDYWREPDSAYLVMRWLRGGSMRESISQGPWAIAAVRQVLDQIAAALTTAHRMGVVHRDIKPANILLDLEGNAFLTDFGIATQVRDAGAAGGQQASIGSPAYVSPEAITHEPVTPRSDIYSLGIVLYELLTGRLPFSAETETELLHRHLYEPMPPSAWPPISSALSCRARLLPVSPCRLRGFDSRWWAIKPRFWTMATMGGPMSASARWSWTRCGSRRIRIRDCGPLSRRMPSIFTGAIP